MTRTLLIIFGAATILCIASFAGAAALGGMSQERADYVSSELLALNMKVVTVRGFGGRLNLLDASQPASRFTSSGSSYSFTFLPLTFTITCLPRTITSWVNHSLSLAGELFIISLARYKLPVLRGSPFVLLTCTSMPLRGQSVG